MKLPVIACLQRRRLTVSNCVTCRPSPAASISLNASRNAGAASRFTVTEQTPFAAAMRWQAAKLGGREISTSVTPEQVTVGLELLTGEQLPTRFQAAATRRCSTIERPPRPAATVSTPTIINVNSRWDEFRRLDRLRFFGTDMHRRYTDGQTEGSKNRECPSQPDERPCQQQQHAGEEHESKKGHTRTFDIRRAMHHPRIA